MARISASNLAQLFRRVGVSLRAGVDILRVWETESQRGPLRQRSEVDRVLQSLKRGNGLAESLRACDGYFPVMAIEMVNVGEQAGRLDAVLIRLADHYEHIVRMRKDFLQGISWPLTQLVLAILAITLLIFIMGILGTMDLIGWGLVGASGAIKFLLLVALFAALIGVVVYSLARGWWGPTPVLLAMKIPIVGPFLQYSAMARFCWSLAVAIEAGMDVRDTLRMALRSTHNPAYTAQHRACDRVIERGGELHEALLATHVFPVELTDTVMSADLSGTHTEALLHMAEIYEDRAKDAAKRLTGVAAGAVWLTVAALIIYMIFRLAMVYFGAINDALEFTR